MSRARLAIAIVWAAAHQVQTGYHITALNGIQAAILCNAPIDSAPWRMLPSWMLPYVGTLNGCVPMKSSRFGIVVALFTAGSLLGSMLSSQLVPLIGRVGTLRVSSILCLLGSLFLAISNTTNDMVFSRLLVGIGSGFATVTVPLYLTELAPSLIKVLGILNQLAMVLGLIIAQALSLFFSRQFAWRFILVFATALAAGLLAMSALVGEGQPGSWSKGKDRGGDPGGRGEEGEAGGEADEEAPLLGARGEETQHLTVREVVRSKDREIRRGLRVILVTQVAQQICGISPVVYFSTSILRKVFKTNAAMVALLILLIKFPASLITIPVLPRTGSRKLLVYCKALESLSLFGLATGLNLDAPALSASCLLIFISSFGLGTGPVTWVVLSEVMPPEARTAAGSIGISLNAMTSFVVSSTFLPLQEWLSWESGPDENGRTELEGEGNVFYVFCAFCVISLLAVRWTFRRYEKAIR